MKREFKIDAEIFDVAYGELLRAKDRIDAKINSGKRLGVRDRDFLRNQIHSIHCLLKPFTYSERMKKALKK